MRGLSPSDSKANQQLTSANSEQVQQNPQPRSNQDQPSGNIPDGKGEKAVENDVTFTADALQPISARPACPILETRAAPPCTSWTRPVARLRFCTPQVDLPTDWHTLCLPLACKRTKTVTKEDGAEQEEEFVFTHFTYKAHCCHEKARNVPNPLKAQRNDMRINAV